MKTNKSSPVLLMVLGWGALYLYLPIGWVFGLVNFASNPVPASLWINLGFSVFLVHVVLVSPVVHFVYPQLSPRWRGNGMRVVRVLLTLAFLMPPLVGFAYFLDGMKQLADVHELLLVVALSVTMGFLLYEAFQKTWVFSMFVWVSIAIPFFFLNDVLNSTVTVWSYLSLGGWFYTWRIALTIAAFMAYLCYYAKTCTDDTWPERVANWSLSFVVLGLYSLSIKILVPIVFSAFSGNADVHPVWDFWWALYFISAFFCRQHSKLSYGLLSALSGVRILTVCIEIAQSYLDMRSGFWELSWLANQLTVLGFFIWFSEVLLRKQTRSLFLKASPDIQ
ncbi:MAG: hypothetical protein KDD51_13040 [Bdellovibrionales bacterium]|nr:hypothetical protein [Bdellovibrionales bacterium]